MCDKQVYLARYSSDRFVTYCRHDTIHLSWSKMTLHMTRSDLGRAVAFLQTAREKLASKRYVGDLYHYAAQDERGYFQIWLIGVGLYLSLSDFTCLVDLIETAVAELNALQIDLPFPRKPYKLNGRSSSRSID